jgi:flagellar hook-associated protein 2
MATVGLSFGSATSGAGFDVAATVTSILAIASAIESPWKAQLTSLQAQDTALSGLGTSLSTLSTDVSALTNFDGVMAAKEGSSSNTDVLTLSAASTSAIAGSHTVTVENLAQTSSTYSNSITNASDTLSGTISFGSGAGQTITLDSTNNTLQKLAGAINNGSYGMTASIVTSTTGSRLSILSNTSGAAGQLNVSASLTDVTNSNAAVTFGNGLTGVDAKLNVDGLETTSASNTVTGAIPGVTFQLLAPSTTPVQIQIANNNNSIETAVQTMVTDYNTVVTGMKTQEGNTAAGVAQPLFGSPTLSLMQEQLSSAILGGAASGAVSNIGQLGITLGDDGTLTLDVSTLDAVLNSNFSDVAGYFQNAGSFGQTFSTALNSLGSSSPTGAISLALAQDTSEETSLNTSVTNEDILIAAQKITLTTELNTANQVLQSIPSQLNEINEIYSAETGYNSSTTG